MIFICFTSLYLFCIKIYKSRIYDQLSWDCQYILLNYSRTSFILLLLYYHQWKVHPTTYKSTPTSPTHSHNKPSANHSNYTTNPITPTSSKYPSSSPDKNKPKNSNLSPNHPRFPPSPHPKINRNPSLRQTFLNFPTKIIIQLCHRPLIRY